MIPRLNPFRARISTLAILFTGFSLGADRGGPGAAGRDGCLQARARGDDVRVEGRSLLRRPAQGCRRPAAAHEGRLDRRGLGRPASARIREPVRRRLADDPPGPALRRPGAHRRLSSRPARSRRADHADRQGGRPDRPVELLADRHAPEGRRLHRRRVRQGGRRDARSATTWATPSTPRPAPAWSSTPGPATWTA